MNQKTSLLVNTVQEAVRDTVLVKQPRQRSADDMTSYIPLCNKMRTSSRQDKDVGLCLKTQCIMIEHRMCANNTMEMYHKIKQINRKWHSVIKSQDCRTLQDKEEAKQRRTDDSAKLE